MFFKLSQKYRNALLNGFASVFFSFLIAILIANLLSVNDRGGLQLIIVNAALIAILCTLGAPFHTAYRVNNDKKVDNDAIFIIPSLIIASFLVFVFDSIGTGIEFYELFIFNISYVLYFYCLERSKNKFELKLHSTLHLIQPLLCLSVLLVYYICNASLSLGFVCWAYIISYVMLSVYYTINSPIDKTKLRIPEIDLKFMTGYWSLQIASALLANVDKLILGYFFSLSHLGTYAVIQTVSLSFSRITDRVSVTYFTDAHDIDYAKVKKKINFACLLLLPAMTLSGYIFGEHLIGYIFSEKYNGNGIVAALLFTSVVISSLAWVLAQKATAVGKPHLVLYRNIFSLIIFVAIVYFFRFGDGLVVVSSALLASSIIRYVISYNSVR